MPSYPPARRTVRTYRPRMEKLEERLVLADAWSSFGGNSQHSSVSSVASQPLEAVHWSTAVDNFPTSRAAHYGGPLITLNNTVIYPYKMGNTQAANAPDFHIMARSGIDGALLWDIATPYIPASYSWYPQNQPVFATATNRVYFAGKGGTIYYRDNPDSPTGTVTQLAFFGSMNHYTSNQAAYDNNVFIETPMTADAQGNIFFGFRVTGSTPSGLVSGIARIAANGTITQAAGSWVSAFQAAGGTDAQIGSVQQNGAPAISNDGQTLYIVVKESGDWVYHGRLVGLDTTTLATRYNSGVLKDPRGADAAILNISSSSPMIAPDGKVFLGVFGNPYNGSRGWMLQFSSDLQTKFTPGGFGWDTTPSIVPSSLLGSQYTGNSPYLIFTKYNNYYFNGGANDGGDGSNGIAILDPNATEVEYHHPAQNTLVMKRILYKVGPTPDWDYPTVSTAVREWCINYGAVDPFNKSVIVNSSDGKFYRWDLQTNTLIEPVRLTSGIGQPYTMTVVGIDGSVYGIQNGRLFAMGQTPKLTIGDISLTEGSSGSNFATFTVSLNYPRTETISVHWATADSTAIAGSDYTSGSGTLTFNPGVMSKTITVGINTDTFNEINESFLINLDTVSNAVIVKSQARATILDDDPQPNLSITDASSNEGQTGTSPYTTFTFLVGLSAPSGRTVSVRGATSDVTASSLVDPSADYVPWNGIINFLPGETSKSISVLVKGDLTFESNELFNLLLSDVSNATLIDDTGVGTILNDDGVPSITIDDRNVNEGANTTFTISLSNPSAQSISLKYATSPGTASVSDYVSTSGEILFPAGVTTSTINVQTSDDALNELSESFFVNLFEPVNGFVGRDKGQGTIVDNDPQPSLSIRDLSVQEGANGPTSFVFVVELSAASGREVTANFATVDGTAKANEGDYSSATGTVRFAPGQTLQSLTILVNGDNINEPDETFAVQLSDSQGASLSDTQGIGTILNDDALVFSVSDSLLVEGNADTTFMVFDVRLSTPSSQIVSIDYTVADGTAKVADQDYVANNGVLTFNAGQILKQVLVGVRGDLRNESDETVLINLSNATGGTIGDSQGIGTILNDDPLPSLSIGDLSEPEMDYNTGTVSVYVQLSAPSGQTVTVDYRTENGTATSTSNIKDYIDTFGTLIFLPGQTVQSFQVSIVGDLRDEPNETVRVILSNPTLATLGDAEGIITILDDDIAYVTINPASVVEGDSGQTMVEVVVDLSNPSDNLITIDFATADGTALAGMDYLSASGKLTYEPGEISKRITLAVLGDIIDEPIEDFEVLLSNPTGGPFLPDYAETDVDILDNDPPIAVDDTFRVNQGVRSILNILQNDLFVGAPFDPKSVQLRDGPLHATIKLLSDGTIDCEPDKLYYGSDRFHYRVADIDGLYTDWVNVDLNINGRPIARSDVAYSNFIGETIIDILENDVDPDNAIDETEIEIVTNLDPAFGLVEFRSDRKLHFTPSQGFDSSVIVEYRLLDAGQAASATSEVLIGVYNQNRNNRFDINQDQFVTPLDVLVAFNSMNLDGIRAILPGAGTAPFYDVNSDSLISPIDALHVINYLNLNGIGSGTTGGGGSSGEGEFSRDSQGGESAIDAHFGPLYQTLSVDNHAPQRSQLMHHVTTEHRENSELAFGNFVAEWANPTRSDEISARNLDWFSFDNQSASKPIGRVSASLRSVSHELEQIFAELQATNETTWLE